MPSATLAQVRLPGTLSARIIFGFAALIITFGGISVSAVLTTDQLNRTIRVIRTGFLQLALESRDLADRQSGLLGYLKDELAGESTPRRVENRLKRLVNSRERMLQQIDDTLAGLGDEVPESHRRSMAKTATQLAEIKKLMAEATQLYAVVMAAPPIDRVVEAPDKAGYTPEQVAAAEAALRKLQRHEQRINVKTQNLQRGQRAEVEDRAGHLERGARQMRFLTILWGATALLVGLLITIWATVNLRPLRRLRDAAREIARGDYGQRIEERGPREVADLAREFNTMGSAIQERERELVRTERLAAIGKMAAMITHEVRNPLSSIGLNTELLEEELGQLEGERPAEARALCRAIQAEVDRLTDITETYLHFARLPKPKLQEESLTQIVRSTTDFEREPMSLRGVKLEVDLAPDLPTVQVDDAQVRQALLNLLRNAADAVAEVGAGSVRVATRAGSPGYVEVVVEDDGPGIHEELAGKIYDPFFSTKEGGTGLGLALTHQIVRDHGGTIRVDSRPGHGARFTVSLPVPGEHR
jgi:two-component system, NtrC family, sensor kinase